MSRQFRINYNNAWHHVMNRGAAFRNIFHSDKDREKFLSLLDKTTTQYNIEIHGYCLMSNHYHLLIKTPLGNLSKAMKYLNSLYAKYHNQIKKIDGPLFRGRFKSTVISHDEYLLHVSRYIHLNPVRAKIVQKPQHYKWSSYTAYLQAIPSLNWLFTDKILNYFTNKDKTTQYKQFTEEKHKKQFQPYDENGKWVSVYGNKDFESIIEKLTKNDDVEITKSASTNFPVIAEIKQTVAKYYKVNLDTIEKPTLLQENIPRAVAMWLARKVGKYTLKAIANSFSNKSYSSISVAIWRIKYKSKKNLTIMEDIHKLEKILLPK